MKPLLIGAFVLFAISCNNDSSEQSERKDGFTQVLKTKEDSLYHELMRGHDVAMAKMNRLKKQLGRVQHELDSINMRPIQNIDQRYKEALLDLQEELNNADRAMFTWMDAFEVDSARGDKDKRLFYLESEKMKVEKVKDNIIKSMRRADSLFVK